MFSLNRINLFESKFALLLVSGSESLGVLGLENKGLDKTICRKSSSFWDFFESKKTESFLLIQLFLYGMFRFLLRWVLDSYLVILPLFLFAVCWDSGFMFS